MESGARSGAPGVAGVAGPGPAVMGRGVDVLEPAGDGAAAASPAESAMVLGDGARAVVWPAMVDEEDEVVVYRCGERRVGLGGLVGRRPTEASELRDGKPRYDGRRQAAGGRRQTDGVVQSANARRLTSSFLIFVAVLLFNRFAGRMVQLGEC